MNGSKRKSAVKTGKIPKGFVLINLSEWEKEELRNLARQSGIELRCALKLALINMRKQLEETVKLKTRTGMGVREMSAFWGFGDPTQN